MPYGFGIPKNVQKIVRNLAGVVKLVNTWDLKSLGLKALLVQIQPSVPIKEKKMDKILIWWENTFGGNSAIWNLDYGKLIIIGILVYHVWFQH